MLGAAGLLAYTEKNKEVVNETGVVAGFGKTHTAWRQALTLLVILTSLLGWLGLIFKSQNLVAVCGVTPAMKTKLEEIQKSILEGKIKVLEG